MTRPDNDLYSRLLGIGREKIVQGPGGGDVPLRQLLYYGYKKGFWPYLRGLAYRPRLARSGGRFFLGRSTRILFPSSMSVGSNVAIGDYVYMNCLGENGVALGDNVRIREFGWVQVTSHLTNPGVGLVVGSNTYIGPHSILGAGGGIEIGRDVTLGAYVQLLAEDHRFNRPDVPMNEQGVVRSGIRVEDDCWIGNNAIILDGVTLGRGAVVGAGSVVTGSVTPNMIVAGNPARPIRRRDAE